MDRSPRRRPLSTALRVGALLLLFAVGAPAQDAEDETPPADAATSETAEPEAEDEPPTPEPAEDAPLAIGQVLGELRLRALQGVPASERDAETGQVDVRGRLVSTGRPFVLVFWSVECPVCRRYAKKLRQLESDHAGQADFVLVLPNTDETAERAREQLEAAQLTWPAFLDPEHAAVKHMGTLVTPTVAVFDAKGTLRYRGAVDDDRLAKNREVAETLLDALRATIEGKPVPKDELRAFGSSVRKPEDG